MLDSKYRYYHRFQCYRCRIWYLGLNVVEGKCMTNHVLLVAIVCELDAICFYPPWHLHTQLRLTRGYLMFKYVFDRILRFHLTLYFKTQDGEDVTHVQSDNVGGLRHGVNNPVGLS
jgi:hypothetical protein